MYCLVTIFLYNSRASFIGISYGAPLLAYAQGFKQTTQAAQEAAQANTPIAQLEQQIHIETLKAQLAEIEAKANKYNAQASVQQASAQAIATELAAQDSPTQADSKAQNRANKLMQFNPKKLASDESR